MKKLLIFVLLIITFTSCSKGSYYDSATPSQISREISPPAGQPAMKTASYAKDQAEGGVEGGVAGGGASSPPLTKASLQDVSTTQPNQPATTRKIIRNAELDLEVEKPKEVSSQVSTIADKYQGFVVVSESRQIGENGSSVTVTLRIPSASFDKAIQEIRALSPQVIREKITGQDVTEEFIDLEARIKTKKALEAQYLEIMKQASKIPDVLEVQQHLNTVRGELEQMEGRIRFLENQSTLSTITVQLTSPAVILRTGGGFFYKLKIAVSDSIDIGQEIILGLIRLVGVVLPLLIFIGLPFYILIRYLIRRYQRQK